MWSSHHVISMDYSNPEYQARGTCASLMPWHGHSGILHRRSTWTKRWWQILVRRHWISWSSTWWKATAWRWWVLHCGCPLVSKLHRNGMKWTAPKLNKVTKASDLFHQNQSYQSYISPISVRLSLLLEEFEVLWPLVTTLTARRISWFSWLEQRRSRFSSPARRTNFSTRTCLCNMA